MAELPSKVHLTLHPLFLSICGPSVYKDDKQRTWLHFDLSTGGVLQVRLLQNDITSEHIAFTISPRTLSTMPSWWTIQLGSRYLDSMGRFWGIIHHIKENGVEEMMLELINNS
ncbi:T-cell leukemia/lymphoma protein 1A-like [Myotis lucifugus]|uniref:T-cell leukemia/lymphoma protein 1A-like n=1 Tax=Myotis lucifugus TaxID=59463 RepID=UPI0003C461C2|nr:T-cell leukemia/lymphoma protein 1A-like [Myotis lucifugus]